MATGRKGHKAAAAVSLPRVPVASARRSTRVAAPPRHHWKPPPPPGTPQPPGAAAAAVCLPRVPLPSTGRSSRAAAPPCLRGRRNHGTVYKLLLSCPDGLPRSSVGTLAPKQKLHFDVQEVLEALRIAKKTSRRTNRQHQPQRKSPPWEKKVEQLKWRMDDLGGSIEELNLELDDTTEGMEMTQLEFMGGITKSLDDMDKKIQEAYEMINGQN
ncbi:hypothetical protein ACP70R_021469 [Stipagrostis hirtigluma subsp. patula]